MYLYSLLTEHEKLEFLESISADAKLLDLLQSD